MTKATVISLLFSEYLSIVRGGGKGGKFDFFKMQTINSKKSKIYTLVKFESALKMRLT